MFSIRHFRCRLARLCVAFAAPIPAGLLALALALALFLLQGTSSEGQSWSASWTQKADAPTGPRGWVRAAFDSANARAVLFGSSPSEPSSSMWQYDALTDRWLQLESHEQCPPSFAPPTGRDEYAFEYDPVNQFFWMFGGSGVGCDGPAHRATPGTTPYLIVDPTLTASTYDFYKDWTVRIGTSTAYVTAYNPWSKILFLSSPLAYSTSGSQYFLYPQHGGGTFSYSTVTKSWNSLTAPPSRYSGPQPSNRLSPAMAYSTRDTAIVMFGGQGQNDTWTLNAETKSWAQKIVSQAQGSPPGLAQLTNSMVYDRSNDVFILFGGCLCVGDSGPSSRDTWAYRLSTNAWTKRTPAVSPPPRQGHHLVYDSANKVVVLFGGFDAPSATYYNDLWVYSYTSNTWTQVFSPLSPSARRLGAVVYDPVRQRTILYGGKNSGSLHDVWTLQLQGPSAGSPAPVLTSLSPASAVAGSPVFTLIVTGANFVPSSLVRWNGVSRPTTYVRGTRLEASIPATDVATAGTAQITVASPAPGGGISSSFALTVTAPSPAPAPPSTKPPVTATPTPSPSPTPTASVTTTLAKRGVLPRGFLDSVGSSGAWGWAADGDRPTIPIKVVLVVDGVDMVTLTTDQPSPDVAAVFPSFTATARFLVPIPPSLRDGRTHQLRAYALDDDGVTRVELNQSPMNFNLAAATTATPTLVSTPAPAPTPAPVSAPAPVPVASVSGQTALSAGAWTELPNTKVLDLVAPMYAAGAPLNGANPLSLYAYSGAGFGQVGGVWGFLLFGGGHAATPDNSLIFLPVDGSSPRRLSGPSPANGMDTAEGSEVYEPSGIYSAALRSRHTYAGIVVGTRNGKPTLFMNGGSLHIGSGAGSGVLRMFDLTQTFAQAMARPDMGWDVVGSPVGTVESQCGWDPVKTQLLCRGHQFAAFFPNTNTWQTIGQPGGAWFGGDVDANVAVDVAGRWMYVIGGGFAERINLDTYAWQDLSALAWAKSGGGGNLGFTHTQNVVWGDTTGYIPGPGMTWDTAGKQVIAYVDANTVLVFDPTKDALPAKIVLGGPDQTTAGIVSPACPALPCSPGGGMFGRFALIPGTTTVALASSVDRNVAVATLNLSALVPAPPPTLAPAVTSSPTPVPPPATPPTATPALAQASTPLTATFLGIDQDKTEQLQPGPDGQADFHIQLSGLKSVPTGVKVTDNGPGVWEWPFNGTNWIVLSHGSDLWFSVWAPSSQKFHVKVTYADSTVAEADATGAAVPIPSPLLPPTPTSAPTPTPPPTPTPTPPPSAGVLDIPVGTPIPNPLPVRTWVRVNGAGALPSTDSVYNVETVVGGGFLASKNMRVFYHPTLTMGGLTGWLVFGGGASAVSMPRPDGTSSGTGSEIRALHWPTKTWKILRPFCVPGAAQPGRPQNALWAFDAKRNRAIMAPGFYFITQAQQSGCGAVEGWGAYGFDFTTMKFSGPDDPTITVPPPSTDAFGGGGWGGDGIATHGIVDPTNDELCRVTSRSTPTVECMNLTTKQWRVMNSNGTWGDRAQPALDVAGRALYVLQTNITAADPSPGYVAKILLDVPPVNGFATIEQIPLPPQWSKPPADSGYADRYLAFDPVNRKLFADNNFDLGADSHGVGVLDVDTKTWEWITPPADMRGNLWAVDNQGVLVVTGGEAPTVGYWLYKVK